MPAVNVLNKNTDTDMLNFTDFGTFVEGSVRSGTAFSGSANRYYRSDTVGVYGNAFQSDETQLKKFRER